MKDTDGRIDYPPELLFDLRTLELERVNEAFLRDNPGFAGLTWADVPSNWSLWEAYFQRVYRPNWQDKD